MSNFTIEELEFIKSELKFRAIYTPEENTEREDILYSSIDKKITEIEKLRTPYTAEELINWIQNNDVWCSDTLMTMAFEEIEEEFFKDINQNKDERTN